MTRCASKAGVEALGNSLRIELRPYGAHLGVAYFAEIETDMTRQGPATAAAAKLRANLPGGSRVAPIDVAIDALERGIARRARRVVAPAWVAPLLPLRMAVQPLVGRVAQGNLAAALELARYEHAPLTTPQPD
jgi:NAD(P)-dependent dehydrogenase (short-subunit alcohol dehydrogenase family)